MIRLVRKAKAPVYPVYFDFQNTHFFYWLGNISWQIRTLRIPTEAFNKRGKKADVYIGEPISPEEIAASRKTRILPSSCINVHMVLKK